MPSNIRQLTVPEIYSSANDDIIYEFDFKPYAIDSVTNNSGLAQVNLYDDFDVVPNIGEILFISSPLYSGQFIITSVSGTATVTINTPYLGSVTSLAYDCYHYRIPTFSFYKGFISFPERENSPLTHVMDFKPVFKPSHPIYGKAYLTINMNGVAKHLFNIISNTEANSVDWSMFNAIRIRWDDQQTQFNATKNYTYVLNSSIKNLDLMERIALGIYLTPINTPLIASSGVTFASIIEMGSDYPVIHKFVNGVKL